MVALMSLIRIYGKEETHKVHVLTIEVLQFWRVEGSLYLYWKKRELDVGACQPFLDFFILVK